MGSSSTNKVLAGSMCHPKSSRWRRVAGQNSHGIRRSHSAKGHHYETKSRRATRRGSKKQPISRQKPSVGGSVAATWTEKCRLTSSPLRRERFGKRLTPHAPDAPRCVVGKLASPSIGRPSK